MLRNKKKQVLQGIIFVFCFALIVFRVLEIPLQGPGDGRDFIRGDRFSDQNVHSAVKYFYHNGFQETAYLPVHDYENPKDTSYTVYTHYPALPDILAGTYANILSTTNIQHLRLFPVLLSVLWFFLIFKVLRKILPDPDKAFLSACIIVLSTYFVGWADTLHKHTYEEAFKWLFVYLLYLYYEHQRNNHIVLGALFLFFIIISNISFEPIVYLAVVIVGFSLIYRKKLFSRETISLGIAAVLGFGLHFYQVVLYYDSFEAAQNELVSAAQVRVTGETTERVSSDRNIHWFDYLTMPFSILNRVERYFLIPGWAVLVFGVLGMKAIKNESHKAYQIGLVLLVSSLIWGVVMPQHLIVHTFTVKQLGLFYGFVIGYGLYAYSSRFKKDFQAKRVVAIALHVLFVGYIVGMLVTQQIWEMYIKYGFGYPLFF